MRLSPALLDVATLATWPDIEYLEPACCYLGVDLTAMYQMAEVAMHVQNSHGEIFSTDMQWLLRFDLFSEGEIICTHQIAFAASKLLTSEQAAIAHHTSEHFDMVLSTLHNVQRWSWHSGSEFGMVSHLSCCKAHDCLFSYCSGRVHAH